MPIIRKSLGDNTTAIRLDLINDRTVPPKVKLALMYLLSKPDDWEFQINDIKICVDFSADSIKRALKWLLAEGFICHEKTPAGQTVWHVFDERQPVDSLKKIPNLSGRKYTLKNHNSYQDCNQSQ